MRTDPDDNHWLEQIGRHDAEAWQQFISRYEGRLLAFAKSRVGDLATAEDIVQDTFLGFLTALPNYDSRTPLESFLFSIAAHKLTDALRRRGIRPRLMSQLADDDSAGALETASPQRKVSSLARTQERRMLAREVLGHCLQELVSTWLSRGEFERLKCIELLFAGGQPNQKVARQLGLSEQAVANHKSHVLQKLKVAATAGRLRDAEWRET